MRREKKIALAATIAAALLFVADLALPLLA